MHFKTQFVSVLGTFCFFLNRAFMNFNCRRHANFSLMLKFLYKNEDLELDITNVYMAYTHFKSSLKYIIFFRRGQYG